MNLLQPRTMIHAIVNNNDVSVVRVIYSYFSWKKNVYKEMFKGSSRSIWNSRIKLQKSLILSISRFFVLNILYKVIALLWLLNNLLAWNSTNHFWSLLWKWKTFSDRFLTISTIKGAHKPLNIVPSPWKVTIIRVNNLLHSYTKKRTAISYFISERWDIRSLCGSNSKNQKNNTCSWISEFLVFCNQPPMLYFLDFCKDYPIDYQNGKW